MIEKEARMARMMIGITIAVSSAVRAYLFNAGPGAGVGTIIGAGLVAIGGIPWAAKSG